MKVTVKEILENPIEVNGKISLECISKYESYHYTNESGEFHSCDLPELITWFTRQVMSLGHDGSMQINFTRFIWHKEYEEDLDKLFPHQM